MKADRQKILFFWDHHDYNRDANEIAFSFLTPTSNNHLAIQHIQKIISLFHSSDLFASIRIPFQFHTREKYIKKNLLLSLIKS